VLVSDSAFFDRIRPVLPDAVALLAATAGVGGHLPATRTESGSDDSLALRLTIVDQQFNRRPTIQLSTNDSTVEQRLD